MFKRLSLLIFSWFLIVCVSANVTAAGEVSYQVDSNYALKADTVEVSHKITLKGSAELGKQTLTLPGTTDSFDVSGTNAKVKVSPAKAVAGGVAYDATDLTLDFANSDSAALEIKYSADDLHSDYERAESVFVPPFDLNGTITSQAVELSAPLDVAIGNIIGLKPNNVTTSGNRQTYKFAQTGKITQPIVLQLGSIANAEVEIKAGLKNDSFWWKSFNVILPLDTNQQQSYIKSIEPKPKSINIDRDGNIVATYNLRPKQQVSVVAKASVQLEQKAYDLEAEGGPEQLDQDISANYTNNTSLWPDSILKDLGLSANELRSKPVVTATQEVHNKLIEQTGALKPQADFNQRIGKDNRKPQTSLDYSDKLVAALRAAGIPARVVGGVITDNQLTKFEQTQLQAWAEVYVPDEGWMTVDPGLGKISKNFFGQSGVQRVALFIWGVNDHIPEFTDQSITINYVDKDLDEQKYTNQVLNGNNFILFPGISLLAVDVNMPPGSIQDEVVVQTNSHQMDLGSLAPLQKARTLKLIIGDKSWEKIPLNLQVAGATKTQATANLNLLGAVVVTVLVILLIWLMIKWYKKSKAPMVLDEDGSQADGSIEDEDLLGVRNQPTQQQAQPQSETPGRGYRLHIKDASEPSAQPAAPKDDKQPPTRIDF